MLHSALLNWRFCCSVNGPPLTDSACRLKPVWGFTLRVSPSQIPAFHTFPACKRLFNWVWTDSGSVDVSFMHDLLKRVCAASVELLIKVLKETTNCDLVSGNCFLCCCEETSRRRWCCSTRLRRENIKSHVVFMLLYAFCFMPHQCCCLLSESMQRLFQSWTADFILYRIICLLIFWSHFCRSASMFTNRLT